MPTQGPEPDPQALVRRFVAAERDDRGDESEEALFALFSELAAAEPPAGFADRVMARWTAELSQANEAASSRAARPVRARRPWVYAVGLVLCALPFVAAALFLPPVVRALAGLWSLAATVEWVADGLVALGQGLAAVIHAGVHWAAVGEILAAPFRTPAAAGLAAASLAVASLAFRALRDLTTRKRSWAYVDPV